MTGQCERAGSRRMARPQGARSVRPMFQTILIGYDGRERGGEATALAEVLRDPYQGTLLLTSAYPQNARMVGGFGVSDEIDELADATKEMLAEAREALPDPARAQIRAVASDSPARALSEWPRQSTPTSSSSARVAAARWADRFRARPPSACFKTRRAQSRWRPADTAAETFAG